MFQAFGELSAQMLVHILLMNAVAPLLAVAAPGAALRSRWRWSGLLLPASLVQITLLWAWHAPPALAAAMRSDGLHIAMQLSLLVAAFWFWSAVFFSGAGRWRAILALLVTGKLFCLLGVLLVFAPRALYPGLALADGHAAPAPGAALGDQQLAGLFMLVACPATYVVAGIVIAARWLNRIEASEHPGSPSPNARHPA